MLSLGIVVLGEMAKLGPRGGDVARDAILQCLEDTNRPVRQEALRALDRVIQKGIAWGSHLLHLQHHMTDAP